MEERLTVNKFHDGTIKFGMKDITVDGMRRTRPDTLYDMYFLSYKTVNDPGEPFRWNPNRFISEKHWLKCGKIIAVDEFCNKCGRIAVLDE